MGAELKKEEKGGRADEHVGEHCDCSPPPQVILLGLYDLPWRVLTFLSSCQPTWFWQAGHPFSLP